MNSFFYYTIYISDFIILSSLNWEYSVVNVKIKKYIFAMLKHKIEQDRSTFCCVSLCVGVSGGTWKRQKTARTWAQCRKVFEKFEMFWEEKTRESSTLFLGNNNTSYPYSRSRVVISNNVKGGTGSGTVIMGLFSHDLELHCFVLFRVGYIYNSYVYVVSNMLHQVHFFACHGTVHSCFLLIVVTLALCFFKW